jgi:hypothetical protein
VANTELADRMVDSGAERIWIVDQDAHDMYSVVAELLTDPGLTRSFDIGEAVPFDGEISVILLERR